jgi:hypothetical protein
VQVEGALRVGHRLPFGRRVRLAVRNPPPWK